MKDMSEIAELLHIAKETRDYPNLQRIHAYVMQRLTKINEEMDRKEGGPGPKKELRAVTMPDGQKGVEQPDGQILSNADLAARHQAAATGRDDEIRPTPTQRQEEFRQRMENSQPPLTPTPEPIEPRKL